MRGSFTRALITGITGQDGQYLSEKLRERSIEVIGTSRNVNSILHQAEIPIFKSDYSVEHLTNLLREYRPQVIYNLAGQSYVSRSWEIVTETIDSQAGIVSNLLQAIVNSRIDTKLINACSAEIFDHDQKMPFNERSPKTPYNPYGCAQLLGYNLVNVFREKKEIWACNAILFPHESIRRSPNFLFQKIIHGVIQIKEKKCDTLELGNLNVKRDWGYAPQYMEGLILQSQYDLPEDFCFCTGTSYSVENIVASAFSNLGMNHKNHINLRADLVRNYEPDDSFGSNSKAKKILNWDHCIEGPELIDQLLKDRMTLETI